MSSVVYTNGRTGSSILAIDKSTLENQSISELTVVATSQIEQQYTETTLQQINSGTAADSAASQVVDGYTSNQALALSLDSPLSLALSYESNPNSLIQIETQIDQYVIPESYMHHDEIHKWDRLCYEQQKAKYQNTPWWTNISGFTSEDPTPGWFEGQFDFPVVDPDNWMVNIPTQVISENASDGMNKNITGIIMNDTVENVKLLYRKKDETVLSLYVLEFEASYIPWQSVDPEDEPLLWQAENSYEMSSYPEIDQKQVPLVATTKLVQNPDTVTINKSSKAITNIIPKWNGNNVDFYFYNAFNSIVSFAKIYKDGVYLKTIELSSYGQEGVINNIDTNVTSKKPIEYLIELMHTDTSGKSSWIKNIVVQTKKPMVATTNTSIELVDRPTNDENYFKLRVPLDKLENLYKPQNQEQGFVIDVSPDSYWFTSILNKRLVVRLSICKYWQGNKIEVGNFIFNPTSADSTNIDGVYNDRGVLSYDTDDNNGDGFVFRFHPYAGVLSVTTPKIGEYYDFRIAEWTLGIEQGLLTGQNLAWMKSFSLENPEKRYRYDSWDEEHPVRFWDRMSPIDPLYDSDDRLSYLARSQESIFSQYLATPTESTSPDPSPHQILNNIVSPNWKTIYALVKDKPYYGMWRRFEFAFRLSNLFQSAERIDLYASYFGYFLVPPEGQEGGGGGPGSVQTHATEVVWLPLGDLQGEPTWLHISTWAHWSETLHISDFISYQHVFNYLYKLATENFEKFQGLVEKVGPIDGVNMTTTVFAAGEGTDEAYLPMEQKSAWENMLTGLSRLIEAYMKEGVRIKYKAVITHSNGQTQDVHLSSINTSNYAWSTNEDILINGQPMNFELITEPEDNPTWVTGIFDVVTAELDSFQSIEIDPESTTQITPGLVPAYTNVDINFDSIDIQTIDTKQFIVQDGLPEGI